MNCCRFCAQERVELKNIFDDDKLPENVHRYLGIQVFEEDFLPHKICRQCEEEIKRIVEYVSKCQKIQKHLHKLLSLDCSKLPETIEIQLEQNSEESKDIAIETVGLNDDCQTSRNIGNPVPPICIISKVHSAVGLNHDSSAADIHHPDGKRRIPLKRQVNNKRQVMKNRKYADYKVWNLGDTVHKKRMIPRSRIYLSAELTAILGAKRNCRVSRRRIHRLIWSLIKERNLFDPENRRFIICDDQLFKIIGIRRFHSAHLMKYLEKHFQDKLSSRSALKISKERETSCEFLHKEKNRECSLDDEEVSMSSTSNYCSSGYEKPTVFY